VILRWVAGVALGLGLVLLLVFLQALGEAPWSPPAMRHLRAMKNRTGVPDSLAPMTLAEIATLPHYAPLDVTARLERRGVSFDGCVQRLLYASDGDLHFEVVPFPRGVESPDTTYLTAEVTPAWSRGSTRWSLEGLVAALHPNHGGASAWDGGPRRARIGGWLLDDFQHDGPAPGPGERRFLRVSGWEIHPVTRIELWDDSLGRFVDLAP
jgi:hypothetical protein